MVEVRSKVYLAVFDTDLGLIVAESDNSFQYWSNDDQMAQVLVKSYFKIDNEFVPIHEFTREFSDKNYVDGAITIAVDGQEILTFKHWDLVDQLWCYIAEGLGKVTKGQVFETYFPDQPLLLRFEMVSPRCMRVTVGHDSYDVDAKAFIFAMKRGAKEFFARMKELYPEASDTWDRYERAADAL